MLSHPVMSDFLQPYGLQPTRLLCPWGFSQQEYWSGSPPRGIFPTGSNPGLLHCRQTLYCLSHQGSPRILEWVGYPFSRGTFDPAIKLGSSALQVDSLPAELPRKPHNQGWETSNIKMYPNIQYDNA